MLPSCGQNRPDVIPPNLGPNMSLWQNLEFHVYVESSLGFASGRELVVHLHQLKNMQGKHATTAIASMAGLYIASLEGLYIYTWFWDWRSAMNKSKNLTN